MDCSRNIAARTTGIRARAGAGSAGVAQKSCVFNKLGGNVHPIKIYQSTRHGHET
jgi:hypothetical protein